MPGSPGFRRKPGLYTLLAALLTYGLLGTSRHLVAQWRTR